MKNITVIGAGTMGNGIAHVFALAGYSVALYDTAQEALQKALSTIRTNLERQHSKGTISAEAVEQTLGRIVVFTNLQEAARKAELVVEAATEDKKTKLEIFRLLDTYTNPSCILASNTSSISIAELAAATSREESVVGMHFMNPVPVMKLVEVVKTKATSIQTCTQIEQLTVSLDKIPVTVNDAPGFVSNRILMPMINEAVYTLQEQVGGVAEIDAIMKLGMAHPMGPLRLADLIGLDVCAYIIGILYEGFGQNPKYAPCPLLLQMVEAGEKGVKSGSGFYQYEKGKEPVVASRFSGQK
jgi:3-hydroxybutyryl-CoA dehydrogenase